MARLPFARLLRRFCAPAPLAQILAKRALLQLMGAWVDALSADQAAEGRRELAKKQRSLTPPRRAGRLITHIFVGRQLPLDQSAQASAIFFLQRCFEGHAVACLVMPDEDCERGQHYRDDKRQRPHWRDPGGKCLFERAKL